MRERALRLGPLVLVALAFAIPVQFPGCGQTSHVVLTRSLADGTPRIDRLHWQTCDKSWYHEHFFAAKAPGVAFVSLPLWLALDHAGLVWNSDEGSVIPPSTVWPLAFLTAVLPAFALLLLLRAFGERIQPGTGTITAVAGGLGTLLLPYATLYGAQIPSTLLGAVAFACLTLRRSPLLAGLFAGLAVTFDYPLALLAVLLAGFVAFTAADHLRELVMYAAGGLAGLLPLLAFNAWAFGNPLHQTYEDAVLSQGSSGHDVVGANSGGFYGIDVPKPHAFLDLLFSNRGLFVETPVVALGVAMCLLPRAGRTARFGALVFLAFLLYDAGYYLPFGGDVPGPRLLIPALPFVLVPLATAFRRIPVTALLLTAVSAASMVIATATRPMIGLELQTSVWFSDLAENHFARTIFNAHGSGSTIAAMSPFFVLIVAGAAWAVVQLRPRLRRRDAALAFGALAVWAVVASLAG